MAKRRLRFDSISLVGPAADPVVLCDRHAPRAGWTDAELEDVIGSAMDLADQRRQQKAARSPRRRKATDAEIAATFEVELANLNGRGKHVKTAAIQATAETLKMSVPQIKRRLKTILDN